MNALVTTKTDVVFSSSIESSSVAGIRLGCACTVHAATHCTSSPLGPAEASGTLLEVRELWDWRSVLRGVLQVPDPRCGAHPHEIAAATVGRKELGVEGDGDDRNRGKEETSPGDTPRTGISACELSSSSGNRKNKIVDGGRRGFIVLPFAKPTLSPPLLGDHDNGHRRLYGFIRVKDADHRLSGWYSLDRIGLKVVVKSSASGGGPMNDSGSSSITSSAHSQHNHIRASTLIRNPILSPVYTQITPGMARTQRAERILDYFDERLLRDGKSPTTIRYIIYANKYIFAPWYYAPYGLLHPSYDPLREIPTTARGVGNSTAATGCPDSAQVPSGAIEAVQNVSEQTITNPYIRDAYLCPFSLRVYPTLSQLKYEIQQYRWLPPHEETEKNQRQTKTVGVCVPQNKGLQEDSASHLLRPPGLKIYEDPDRGIAMFEVDGSKHVTYARHIFLLGKSFLEKKLAGHDVHNYFFYVVCLHKRYFPEFIANDTPLKSDIPQSETALNGDMEDVWFFAGYFSWEKNVEQCNLACIVTLPCFGVQAHSSSLLDQTAAPFPSAKTSTTAPKGLGQFMIRASYELARRRGHIAGTPERPLSDLGSAAYLRFWCTAILEWWYHRLNLITDASSTPSEHLSPSTSASAVLAATNGSGGENVDRLTAFPNTLDTNNNTYKERESKAVSVDTDSDSDQSVIRIRADLSESTLGMEKPSEDDVEGSTAARVGGVRRRSAGRYGTALQRQKRMRQHQLRKRGSAAGRANGSHGRGSGGMVGARGSRRRRRRRVESEDDDDDDNDNDDDDDNDELQEELSWDSREVTAWLGGTGKQKTPRLHYTIEQVAAGAGLDPADALRAVLHAGLLQWSREERCPMWVLPCAYIRREHQRWVDRRREAMDQACFIPKYLLNQGLSYHTPADYWKDKDPDTYF